MIMGLIPGWVFNYVLKMLGAYYTPLGKGVAKVTEYIDYVIEAVNRLTGGSYKLTIGDLIMMGMSQVGIVTQWKIIIEELYSWYSDVIPCVAKRVLGKYLKLDKYFSSASEVVEAKTDETCCFKEVVNQLKQALELKNYSGYVKAAAKITQTAYTAGQKVTEYSRWALGKIGTGIWDAGDVMFNYFFTGGSDIRLKILLLKRPVYCLWVRTGNSNIKKRICFYLFMWNPKRLGHFRPEEIQRMGVGDVHIGVIAQQVKKVFPDAVHPGDHGYLTIDTRKIPCALSTVMEGLNGYYRAPRHCDPLDNDQKRQLKDISMVKSTHTPRNLTSAIMTTRTRKK